MSDVVDGRAGLLCLALGLALTGCQAGGKVESATRAAPMIGAGSEVEPMAQNRPEAKDGEIKMAYVATRTFQILPPRPTLLDPSWGQLERPADKEELAGFMKIQQAVVLSDDVVESVLKIEAVRQTAWYRANYQYPVAQLKRCLKVVPDPAAGLLRITVSGDSPADVAVLVNAVADEYMAAVETNQAMAIAARRRTMDDMVSRLQAMVDQQQEEMKDFRINNKIQGSLPQVVNIDLTAVRKQAGAMAWELAAAQAAINTIRNQVAAGTLELNGGQQDAVEQDGVLRAIENLRIQAQTERDMELKKSGEDKPSDLQARLDSLTRQAKDRREVLGSDMKRRIQEDAAQRFTAAQAMYADAAQQLRVGEVALQDLDRKLVQYGVMQHDLDELMRALDDLKHKKLLLDLSGREDAARVRPLGTAATVPTAREPIEP